MSMPWLYWPSLKLLWQTDKGGVQGKCAEVFWDVLFSTSILYLNIRFKIVSIPKMKPVENVSAKGHSNDADLVSNNGNNTVCLVIFTLINNDTHRSFFLPPWPFHHHPKHLIFDPFLLLLLLCPRVLLCVCDISDCEWIGGLFLEKHSVVGITVPSMAMPLWFHPLQESGVAAVAPTCPTCCTGVFDVSSRRTNPNYAAWLITTLMALTSLWSDRPFEDNFALFYFYLEFPVSLLLFFVPFFRVAPWSNEGRSFQVSALKSLLTLSYNNMRISPWSLQTSWFNDFFFPVTFTSLA